LFQTPLFASQLLQQMKPLVVCNLSEPSDVLQPTGIPPHVSILISQQKMGDALNKIPEIIAENCSTTVTSIMSELESRSIQLHQVTPDGVKQIVNSQFQVSFFHFFL
jgi:hypothetical protein